jgi:Uma2 family endonuclease
MAPDDREWKMHSEDGALEWDPSWDDAQEFPIRIPCTVEEYLATDVKHLLEYCEGFLEVLPVPTTQHQRIVVLLCDNLKAWVTPRRLGEVRSASLKVRIAEGKFREPDVLFMKREHAQRAGEVYWERPDLVMEVLSEENRCHDLVTKREEYAQAGIPEYWIADPQEESITVLVDESGRKAYIEHGIFRKGDLAISHVLPGFRIEVAAIFRRNPEPPR